MKHLLPLLAVVMLSSAAMATTLSGDITRELCRVRTMIQQIIPTVALILILLAGLVYAAGQTFGAEMKAKAQGWAMSLLVGGIMGLVLAALAPFLVDVFASMGGMSPPNCGAVTSGGGGSAPPPPFSGGSLPG